MALWGEGEYSPLPWEYDIITLVRKANLVTFLEFSGETSVAYQFLAIRNLDHVT